MAKRKYRQRDSGLILPDDDLVSPSPNLLPWYARRDRKRPDSRRNFRFSPGCCCCRCMSGAITAGTSSCRRCSDESRHARTYYLISISGFDVYSEYNGDWELSHDSIPTDAYWSFDFNLHQMRISTVSSFPPYPDVPASNHYLFYYRYTGPDILAWYYDFGTTNPLCSCLKNLSLTLWSGSSGDALEEAQSAEAKLVSGYDD